MLPNYLNYKKLDNLFLKKTYITRDCQKKIFKKYYRRNDEEEEKKNNLICYCYGALKSDRCRKLGGI